MRVSRLVLVGDLAVGDICHQHHWGGFLGWFLAMADRRLLGEHGNLWRLAIGTGFVGAYTTFSTVMVESDKLLRDGEWLRAITYLSASLFVGLLVVRLGFLLGDRM